MFRPQHLRPLTVIVGQVKRPAGRPSHNRDSAGGSCCSGLRRSHTATATRKLAGQPEPVRIPLLQRPDYLLFAKQRHQDCQWYQESSGILDGTGIHGRILCRHILAALHHWKHHTQPRD